VSTPHESDERARGADPGLARLDELGRLTELGRETRQLRESELARLSELERWGSIQRYVPYGGLVIGTVLTLLVRDVDWPARWVALAFAGAAALWVRLCRPEYGVRPVPGPVFFVVWTLLAGALVVCSPWNGFVAFVGYLFALDLLPGRWRFAGVAVTAVLAATSQLGGLPPATGGGLAIWGAVVLVNAVLASWFGYYGWLTDQQSAERKRTIDELNEANERLAAAMKENAQLQAQLVASARDAGVRDERERLAREIHDTLAQGLAGIVAQLQAARTAGATSRERHLDTAAELARSTLVEARRSVQALRPEPLEAARLPDALADVAARWSEVSGVPAAVTTTGTARQLHPEVEIALLRTGQEALANVGKHATASRVGVTLSYMEDVVTLDVRDDGIGFDPTGLPEEVADGSGFGLTGMRRRVARVAGRLEIESAPGEGTAVSATVPAIPA
jgi:signal transduction histidine kinase